MNSDYDLVKKIAKESDKNLFFSKILFLIAAINCVAAIYAMIIHNNIVSTITLPISATVVIGSFYFSYRSKKLLKRIREITRNF